ncbi:hypothetical protein [Pseudoroseomonas ludipueritiae]|uniref:Uncharacterized protein n=1 Tax=Pseudoroseomonas ludipueritiae TaxID=198093 RepID=A0ABR7R7P6_9PROT|nr:hypothetical protein [Pseudoroseomonas ludipueritiae]MBC9177805.1 hypothetical protein [Pseudoroseomonas ludipueritiae]MCG7363149.1 hypothetical protein [Roseomonas sp. ACRSG]
MATPARSRATKTAAAAPAAPAGTNHPVIKDKALIKAAETYATNKAEISRMEAENDDLKPRLLAAMGGAPTAYAGSRVLTQSDVETIKPTPNQVITKEMVGQVIPGKKGRKGYTQLSVQ